MSGSGYIFLSKSDRAVTEPGPTVILFLCPNPNRERHSFKLKHWVCVMQSLLLRIQLVYRGYTCGLLALSCTTRKERLRDSEFIYFFSTFWPGTGRIWSEPERNFKIFVWNWSKPSGTSVHSPFIHHLLGHYCKSKQHYQAGKAVTLE